MGRAVRRECRYALSNLIGSCQVEFNFYKITVKFFYLRLHIFSSFILFILHLFSSAITITVLFQLTRTIFLINLATHLGILQHALKILLKVCLVRLLFKFYCLCFVQLLMKIVNQSFPHLWLLVNSVVFIICQHFSPLMCICLGA